MANRRIKILLLLCCLQLAVTAPAQIMMEKEGVIAMKGLNHTTGIDDKGNEYLLYDEEVESPGGYKYTRSSIYYFKNYMEKEICTHEKHIFPETEAFYYLLWLDNTKLKKENLRWKDTLTQYLYKAQFIKPFFTLTIWKGGEGVTEKFKDNVTKVSIKIE